MLDLEVAGHTPRSQFTANAAGAKTTPAGFGHDQLLRVVPDTAGTQRASNPLGAVDICRDHGGGKSEGAVVGKRDRLGFAVDAARAQHWAEDFFTPQAAVGRHVPVQGRAMNSP